jgi:hypothetical protein
MTRESRLLLTLVVMSGIGVAGLMLVANQYRKALTHTAQGKALDPNASVRAIKLVDGYLAARAATRGVVATDSYRLLRSNALAEHGMTHDDYVAVRAAWRTFRAGGRINDQALVGAFTARRGQLESAGLGANEALDDAIN